MASRTLSKLAVYSHPKHTGDVFSKMWYLHWGLNRLVSYSLNDLDTEKSLTL